MKALRFTIGCFTDWFRHQWRVLLIIIISMAVTMSVCLSVCARIGGTIAWGEERKALKSSYNIFVNFTGDSSFDVVEDVLNEPLAPPIKNLATLERLFAYVTDPNATPYLIAPDGTLRAESEQVFSGYALPDTETCEKWCWYIPQYQLLEGRWFTEEELVQGAKVIVLEQETSQEQYDGAGPGDEISIAGYPFTVIGIVKPSDEPLRTWGIPENIVPYRAAQACTDPKNGFELGEDNINLQYEEPLSDEALQAIAHTIATQFLPEGDETFAEVPESHYSWFESDYLNQEIIMFTVIGAVVLLCCLNLYYLFRYLMQKNLYQYMIFKVCGIRGGMLAGSIYVCFALITLIAAGLGILLNKALRPLEEELLIYKPVEPFLAAILVVGMLVIMTLSISGLVKKVLKKQPVDRSLWRQ